MVKPLRSPRTMPSFSPSDPSSASPFNGAMPDRTRERASPNHASLDHSSPALVQFLQQQIELRGPLTFAQYMDGVLYHPQCGYYSDARGLGPQGDFVTSSHLCADFGELLAEQFVQMWQILGRPQSFTLLEMGAGQGLLATDVLRALEAYPDCLAAVDYGIIEKSARLREQQRSRVQSLSLSKPPRWLTWEEIESDSIAGCCFSNELVDALPVHLIEIQDGKLFEVYVELRDGPLRDGPENASDRSAPSCLSQHFTEKLGPLSTPQLTAYFDELNLDLSDYPNGYRSEVNLAAQGWLNRVGDRLRRGYLLTIDYGYSAERYYSLGRSQGTLQAYFQHSYHNNPYINIGRQDLTAHVNFTALEQWGEALGLQKLGFTQQALLLMALGLGDRITALASDATDMASVQRAIQRREVLHQLMNPMGVGGFGALVQGKGLTPAEQAQPLKGWTVPPL